jgi:hypothetical protein
MAKMHPSAIDLVLAVWSGYMQDARTQSCMLVGAARRADRFSKTDQTMHTSSCRVISCTLYGGLYGGSGTIESEYSQTE